MKKLTLNICAGVLLLSLSACPPSSHVELSDFGIPIPFTGGVSYMGLDNFDQYWQKGAIDADLAGKWKQTKGSGTNQPFTIVKDDSALRIDGMNQLLKSDDLDIGIYSRKTIYLRTLNIGKYKFLLIREKDKPTGETCMYEITQGQLLIYTIVKKKVSAYIQYKAPGTPVFDGNDKHVPVTFNDAAFKVLSEMPNNHIYWSIENVYKRLEP